MNTLLAVLTGGGITAAFGLIGGWLDNHLGAGRDQAAYERQLEMAREEHANQRQTAREAAAQDRLERTYMELATYLSRHADWEKSVQPMLGQPSPPDPMTPAEQWRIEALVTLHASPEVKRLLAEWRKHASTIENADITIRTAGRARDDESSIHVDADRESLAMSRYRAAMQDADRSIREQMYSELQGG